MLSKEQAESIKKQLLTQIENFPENQRKIAEKQLKEMSIEQLEEFLKQNKLINEEAKDSSQCVFCMINKGKIPSAKIAESDTATAILEINPISKAHTIIIPKTHMNKNDIPEKELKFAQEIAEKIKQVFSPKKVKIIPSEMFGHGIINILPIYKNENINSPRKKATPKQLKETQELFTTTIEIQEKKQLKKQPEQKAKEKLIKKETPEQKAKREKEEIAKLPKAPKRQP